MLCFYFREGVTRSSKNGRTTKWMEIFRKEIQGEEMMWWMETVLCVCFVICHLVLCMSYVNASVVATILMFCLFLCTFFIWQNSNTHQATYFWTFPIHKRSRTKSCLDEKEVITRGKQQIPFFLKIFFNLLLSISFSREITYGIHSYHFETF